MKLTVLIDQLIRIRDMLIPEHPVVFVKKATRPLRDVAKDRLAELRAQYKQIGQNYDLPKAREGAWVDGFIEGARMLFTEEK